MVYVVMGVSGCGKSAVGGALAERLGLPFFDADDFHPPTNKAKMSAGVALDDDDRAPWLAALADKIAHWNAGAGAVLACSALKRRYRDVLRGGGADAVVFVFLDGSFELIRGRMAERAGHFMPTALLESQFAALERPNEHPGDDALSVSVEPAIDHVVNTIVMGLPPAGG